MKYQSRHGYPLQIPSPSVWREWIEILPAVYWEDTVARLPPCGGSGLKYDVTADQLRQVLVSLRVEGVD